MTAEQRTEATRRKILMAACEVIAEVGFEGVRMRLVADRAQVSSALLHYHFENREKLFLAAMRYSFEHAGKEGYDAPPPDDRSNGSPHAWHLARIIDACMPINDELRRSFLLWQELWLRGSRDPESKALASGLYLELCEWMGGAIRNGIESGEFRDCDVPTLTDQLLALTDGYGIRLAIADPAFTIDRAREQIWAVASRDLGIAEPFPRPPQVRAVPAAGVARPARAGR
jgi:AcrR family transcriptional regulator